MFVVVGGKGTKKWIGKGERERERERECARVDGVVVVSGGCGGVEEEEQGKNCSPRMATFVKLY